MELEEYRSVCYQLPHNCDTGPRPQLRIHLIIHFISGVVHACRLHVSSEVGACTISVGLDLGLRFRRRWACVFLGLLKRSWSDQ